MQRRDAQLVLLAPLLLAAGSPTPRQAIAGLQAAGPGALVACVALAAWACAGWLLLIAFLTGLEVRGAGAARAAGWLLRLVAPATVRTTAKVAIGITVTTSLGGTAAWADPPTPSAAATTAPVATVAQAPDYDWPGAAGAATSPVAQPPTAPAARTPVLGPPIPILPRARPTAPTDLGSSAGVISPKRPSTAAATTLRPHPLAVTVRSGDCLWTIAERALGESATPARIAQSWPSWWSANRQVIGDDPDLLRPGTRLLPPRA